MYCTRKVTEDLLWVGADDRRLACFEGVYGVPDGVSYNSYLLLDEKTVLFDTVDKAVYSVFLENLAHGLNSRSPDYLVIHHMEPDHAATLELVLQRHPETTVICNAKIQTMIAQFFPLDLTGRIQLVKEGDTFSSGKHQFTFVMAPMVHWPEVMMTYESTEKILFTADAFGTFGALNGRLFNDETDFFAENIDEARRYYTNIVGKYGPQVQAVLKKAAKLDIAYVCPLHGFVWRSHFGDFLEKYLQWSSYTPEEQSVLLAYASVYGHTENAANILAARLCEKGVKVRMYDTSVTPASYIVSDAFRCSHLVFAATTYNAGVFVTMENLLHDIAAHNLQNRKVALIENGSWAPTSGKVMQELLAGCKNMEFIGEKVTLKSALTEGQLSELETLAQLIADEIAPKPAAPAPSAAAPASAVAVPFDPDKVDNKAFNKFSYGVEVLTTRVDGKDYGCIINTAGQVASADPKKITISCIKKNHTCDMVAKAGRFNISILTEDAPYSLFQRFGFQSGRDVDKFEDLPWDVRTENGIRYIPKYTNAVLSCEIIDVKDLETQTLYIANVVEARVLSDAPSCTYGYYHAHIKPKKNPAPEQKECWVCKVCGYVYEGAELPEDFTCPLCKHGKDEFEHVLPDATPKQKGYVCSICGHFEPCEGELPADYVCPLCHHGREDFTPAEQ
ncbi:MAG: flavin reductase [Oscillospiraceae bacterium]|nr:flavin reductase [Oscillospiraceae bacterium]